MCPVLVKKKKKMKTQSLPVREHSSVFVDVVIEQAGSFIFRSSVLLFQIPVLLLLSCSQVISSACM